jgi:hypothetical protein
MSPQRNSVEEIAHYRLLSQQIARSRFNRSADVISHLGAMQAQDYTGALWGIGLRVPNATEKSVEEAIARRQIVRTWPMRGTLHFVAAADARWMLELLTPRVVAGAARRRLQLELDEAVFTRCRTILINALQRNRQLTREALIAELDRGGVTTNNQRSYHIFWRLAQEALICFAARSGKQPTFALFEEWITKSTTLDRNAALAELARRYFTSHGPATLQDFVWWSGLKVSDARLAVEAAKKLSCHTIEGKTYWMSKGLETVAKDINPAFLLPAFDEYLLGYKDRSAVLDAAHAQKIVPGSNGMFLPTIVVDGRVVGIWKRTVKAKSAVIIATPFGRLKKIDKDSIGVAAEQYGSYLQLPVEVRFPK